jgi:DNA-binding MarR family transcriptional regulator/GNAT superfamily N-acetyltransferase
MVKSEPLDGFELAAVDSIRSFNRIYTREIGLLNETIGNSTFSLSEARVLFEVAQKPATAKQLAERLSIDSGYLSRIIKTLVRQKIICRKSNHQDGRSWLLQTTKTGQVKFENLEAVMRQNIFARLVKPRPQSVPQIVQAMQIITNQLGLKNSDPRLRALRSGDIGWIIHRQGLFYNQLYRWDIQYEALVAKILSEFVTNLDSQKENAWIAETDGVVSGSVFLVKETQHTARLRLLFVEPSSRGSGLGKQLVRQCTEFSRLAGYQKIVLWTQSNLTAARHIYQSEGYKLINTEPHTNFGIDHIGETWMLDLMDNTV